MVRCGVSFKEKKLREVELEGNHKVTVSKWKREEEDGERGLKLSFFDDDNMVTVFLSLEDCEKVLVALYKERDEVLKDLKKK